MTNYDFTQLTERFNHWHGQANEADPLNTGAQIVVRHKGEMVYEQVAGQYAGKATNVDTPFLVFSCTKAFTAACIWKLIGEGRVDFDAPVAKYWPQFAKHGKGEVTVRQVIGHTAGLPSYQIHRQVLLWPFWPLVTRHVAGAKLQYPAGEKFAYHIVNNGWILGEVVRRVTGMPIDEYFAQAFTKPMGMDRTWMKYPGAMLPELPKVVCGAPDQKTNTKIFNTRLIRLASMPAGGMKSTAREMAMFYQMLINGGDYNGERYLQAETIDYATQNHYEGWDHQIERNVRFGLGVHLGGEKEKSNGETGPTMGSASTPRTFGHQGNRSCMAWADPDEELVVTYTTNYLLAWGPHLQRWKDLSDGAWAGVGVNVEKQVPSN